MKISTVRKVTVKCENCGKDFEAASTADVENGPSVHDLEGGQTTCDACNHAAQAAWHRELDEVRAEAQRRFDEGWITANERDRMINNYMCGV